jgi:hypothetical protein
MTYLLPPLNPLRAFEAAARHLSLKLAAHELHVTPAAVGQQVKALEDRLGVRLFERLHKQLVLTTAGHTWRPCRKVSIAECARRADPPGNSGYCIHVRSQMIPGSFSRPPPCSSLLGEVGRVTRAAMSWSVQASSTWVPPSEAWASCE